MKALIQQYLEYNLWANQELAGFFLKQDQETFFAPIANSFPTIKATFLHIYGAELIWLGRLKGETPQFPEMEDDRALVLNRFLAKSKAFLDFVSEWSDEDFAQTFSFTTTEGNNLESRKVDAIFHCMNHSTYHRGQLVTLSKQLGLDGAPSTDLIWYLRKKEKGIL